MKKLLFVASLAVMTWGCAKKMTPAAQSESPATNNGSLSSTNTNPATGDPNMGKITGAASTTAVTSTSAGSGTNENAGSRSQRAAATGSSPEAAAIMAGMSTYNAKCGRCHGLKVTTNYTADRWASILAVMAPKANLTEDEKNNVYAYVKENSKK